GIEDPDRGAALFRNPQPVLWVHVAAPGSRIGGRRRERSNIQGLRIYLDNILAAKIRAIKIVLRVGDDAVGAKPIRRRAVLRQPPRIVDGVPLAGLQIEPILIIAADPY